MAYVPGLLMARAALLVSLGKTLRRGSASHLAVLAGVLYACAAVFAAASVYAAPDVIAPGPEGLVGRAERASTARDPLPQGPQF